MALEGHRLKPSGLKFAMELDSTEAIKSAVEAGLGAGFVSKWAIAKDTRAGGTFRIVEVEGLHVQRDFLMIYAAGPEPQGLVQEFRRFVVDRAAMMRGAVHGRRKRGT
jgi:DNA-binding transcriptional LysR family regulator